MWTAFILAAILAAGSVAYGAWAYHVVAHGAPAWPFVVGIPFAYLAVPLLLTSFWFALAWWFRAERPDDIHLPLSARIAMFGREFRALARSVPRMILYRQLMPDPRPAPARLPILLLHGVGCNAGVWSGFRRHLENRGIGPVYALSYGPPLASIEHFADQVADRIAGIEAATGAAQVVLVGHSMGGLVARAYLRQYGGARVRRLITIGTPHYGSMHAWLMAGASLAQMRPKNAWLSALNGNADGADGVPVASIWSWHDSMVTPQTSSRIDWGENIVLTGIAHNALLDDPTVWAKVVAQIQRAATNGSPE
jgi:triacylglycerol esterase/lipase EstA (alpha/beta hydrolase family)